MVDDLTQESFQTGKAVVTVSVDLITAIAEACKRSEEMNGILTTKAIKYRRWVRMERL